MRVADVKLGKHYLASATTNTQCIVNLPQEGPVAQTAYLCVCAVKTSNMKPILYLDIDDTILSFRGNEAYLYGGVAARGASSFLRWAQQHFEIRPLTGWCNDTGEFTFDAAAELEQKFGMSKEFWLQLRGLPCPVTHKVEGIDWLAHEQGRLWVWLEDRMEPDDADYLRGRNCFDNWIPCNVTKEPTRLLTVRELLTKRFNLETA